MENFIILVPRKDDNVNPAILFHTWMSIPFSLVCLEMRHLLQRIQERKILVADKKPLTLKQAPSDRLLDIISNPSNFKGVVKSSLFFHTH